jgi:muconolactone delta-isomerase
MLFLLNNRTHRTLTPEQYGHLAALAKQFYASVPAGVTIRGEWAAVDQSRNYTLLDAPDLETVQRMQAPFEPYVDMEIVPVVAFSGWTAS